MSRPIFLHQNDKRNILNSKKYPELQKLPSQFKRALVELKGQFPETKGERIPFEEKLLVQIKEMLEEPDLNLHRVQLESVSKSKLSDQYVVVQFLIMNGKNEKTIPHDMIMKLSRKYNEMIKKVSRNHHEIILK